MTLDQTTQKILSSYLADIQQLPNETAKRQRFAALVAELFPGSTASSELAFGAEKLVRITTLESEERRGFVDTYYGNAVIEFEHSLKATETHALKQLKEYTSALWNEAGERRRRFMCIVSDGLTWKSFLPSAKTEKSPLTPEDVELKNLRTLVLSEESLADFWIWLTSFLFRPSRTEPTTERFRIDFGTTSPQFVEAIEALYRSWEAIGPTPEIHLAFDTWQRYLTVTYGQLADQKSEDLLLLFLKHTYLASLARLLIWAALSKGETASTFRAMAQEIHSGLYFHKERIENLVEDDFFQWVRRPEAETILASAWERTLAQLQTYDLTNLKQDIFKGIYQELVDPKDRHDLGEYYTPDWLCERMVSELLPPKGFVSVLDPSCGSGSFIRAAIAHLLKANPGTGDTELLQQILENVVGIDIHPLAVIISRATYVLAIRSLLKSSKRPIQIPVYLADALFLPVEVKQLSLGEVPGFEIRFGGDRKVSIPEEMVKKPDLFDPAITIASEIAKSHAQTGKETRESLSASLEQRIPALKTHQNAEAMISAVWNFASELSTLIKQQQNSIWAFIVRNSYRPAMMRDRFDFILGNPPWLSYRYIADPEYQAEIKKRAVEDYGIAPKNQNLFTHMELATVFLAHALSTFAKPGGQLGFVMPLSVLAADQHQNLRSQRYRAPLRLTSYWDLREVRPVFNVPCCVLFAIRESKPPRPQANYSLPAVEWEGALPARNLAWDEAKSLLSKKDVTAQLIYLGSHTAFSSKTGETTPREPSPYAKSFHQGATIVPRSFYFVEVSDLDGVADTEHVYFAETDTEQAKEAKKPYKEVSLKGLIEGRFLFSTALSKNLLPFALVKPVPVLLPCEVEEGKPVLRNTDSLRRSGYRGILKWMESAEKIWKRARKRKAERQTVYQRLDYNQELTQQSFFHRHLVLYNASGTNLSAAVFDRQSHPIPFIVEHKLYWAGFDSVEMAHYLAAILNSSVVNQRIKPFQSLGLMGERDIHKKVLELPIPLFNEKSTSHKRLAVLSLEAHARASALIQTTSLPRSLAQRRGMVRELVRDTLEEIDNTVREILG